MPCSNHDLTSSFRGSLHTGAILCGGIQTESWASMFITSKLIPSHHSVCHCTHPTTAPHQYAAGGQAGSATQLHPSLLNYLISHDHLRVEASGAFQAFSFINVGCQRLVPSVRDSYLVGNCCYLLNHLVGTISPQASHWGQQPLLAFGHRGKVSLFHVQLRPSHHVVLCFCLFILP